jgi:DUF4097 and DUF4098 domain-containing protein YvlB
MRSPRLVAPLFLLLCATGCVGFASQKAEVKDEWRRSYTLSRGATFEIRNTNGQIRVEASDRDTVDVVAVRTVKAPSEAQAKATLEDLVITETVTSSGVSLRSRNEGFSFMLNRSRRVDYTVRAPRWMNVTLDSTNGGIEVTGTGGPLRAESTNGEITGTSLQGGAVVETTNGDVRLEFVKLDASGVRSSTTNGSIDISLPRDTKASLSAKVTNGSITASDFTLTTTEQSRRKLEATIGGGGPTVRLSTTNGAIQVRGR